MSSKIIVKRFPCFHVENYSHQQESTGAAFVLWWYRLQGRSSHHSLEPQNWVMLFGAWGNDRLLLHGSIMAITVSIVSALLKVAILQDWWERTAWTRSGTELGMKAQPRKISSFTYSLRTRHFSQLCNRGETGISHPGNRNFLEGPEASVASAFVSGTKTFPKHV